MNGLLQLVEALLNNSRHLVLTAFSFDNGIKFNDAGNSASRPERY